MMKTKSRESLLSTVYLNRSEIARLLDIPRPRANKIFALAMKEDKRQLGERHLYDTKVRIKTVLDVAGVNYNLLARQIKAEQESRP